ncbi:CHY zinc finger domain-containing protein [Cardiosporidium cionae]|uniref:CHY zinc finger domain-containing protein n=1 Tax=Cardiosporidium cionae TaxID=476202 RepID=A0ABQ7J8W9_9APIC|nr:CHY zinc finger domain-containing protein [Cardiosporidium cionae]|eukprot:KAF8820105.1 CHY zinc finger domain-containing protein [Cardiosporidium cionae]
MTTIPAEFCSQCKSKFGEYWCSICNFWDDEGTNKQIFHCDRCGICRVGGRENYFHCDVCQCCLENDDILHRCSICYDGMFHSTDSIAILQCGHALHNDCMQNYIKSWSRKPGCPICAATMV